MATGRFQRMVGIPEDEYQHLKSLRQSNDPLQNKFVTLSSDYNRQGLIHDPHTRVQRQSETLNEMINIKDVLKQRLLDATPKPYQTRAQTLFQFVANKININERGEVLNADGSVIAGSNIGDLIQHAVRDRRRNMVPEGWKQFLHILRENNVPRMILNYDTFFTQFTLGSRSWVILRTGFLRILQSQNVQRFLLF